MSETRKQELWKRVNAIYSGLRVPENGPLEHTKDAMLDWVKMVCYKGVVEQVKSFLDRDCKGEPLEMIVSTPMELSKRTHDNYSPPPGLMDDVVYTAKYGKTPNYEQVIFDQLLKYNLIPEDSKAVDYSFLFPSKS